MRDLSKDYAANVVKWKVIGRTIENREIKILQINTKSKNAPIIFIDAGAYSGPIPDHSAGL